MYHSLIEWLVIWWGVAALVVLVALVVLFGVSTFDEIRKIAGLASREIFEKKGYYIFFKKAIYKYNYHIIFVLYKYIA